MKWYNLPPPKEVEPTPPTEEELRKGEARDSNIAIIVGLLYLIINFTVGIDLLSSIVFIIIFSFIFIALIVLVKISS